MDRRLLISVGLVVCLVMAFCLPMCAPAPPVEEEAPPVEEELASSIRAYMCSSPDNNVAVANFITKEMGVQVRQRTQSCGELYARLEAEGPRFSADMGILTCIAEAIMCKEKGWSIPYASPAWEGAGPMDKDPDNYYVGIGCATFVLVGNKNMLDEAGYTLPESWDELLDPKWKDEIIAPSPLTSGTAFRMIYAFMTHYGFNAGKGEEGGWEYMEALDKNIHHYTRSGNAPTDLVGRGEFMLALTSHSMVAPRIEQGYPLVWTIPKEGVGPEPVCAFTLKGTKEEYTCQKIIDVLGTVEFAKLFAGIGYATRFPEAPSALFGGTPYWTPNIDLEWANVNRSRLCDEWKERIGRVAQ